MNRVNLALWLRRFGAFIDRPHTARISRFTRRIFKTVLLIATRVVAKNKPVDGASGAPSTIREQPDIPDWLIDEMLKISKIDPTLYPDKAFLNRFYYYAVPIRREAGQAYFDIVRTLKKKPEAIILAPWLKRGGADLSVLHHLEALDGQGVPSLLITTRDKDSDWLSKIPESTQHVDFGRYAAKLSKADQEQLLSRLILQIAPKMLHNINSDLGWRIIQRFGLTIRANRSVFCTVFCDDFSLSGRPTGYGRVYVPKCYELVDKIFTDNQAYIDVLRLEYGFSEQLFECVYSPFKGVIDQEYRTDKGKVLWAGRLDRQKRLDLLLKVATQMPDTQFDVWGKGLEAKPGPILRQIEKLENVTLCGGFDGIQSLPTREYAVFLYTSGWDGLPNVLLEVTATGLPIVASNVGGISELINSDTGVSVDDENDIAGYVKGLRLFLEQPELGRQRVKNAQKLLRERHSIERFRAQLKALGYFGE